MLDRFASNDARCESAPQQSVNGVYRCVELLAIIAYNQPVTKSFVEQIRGVDSSSVVNSLVAKGLVQEMGRLEIPGRPISYGTTEHFLRCFGMQSIETLPKIPQPQEQPAAQEEV